MTKSLINPSELLAQNLLKDPVRVQSSLNGLLATITLTEWYLERGENFAGGYFWDSDNLINDLATAEFLIIVAEDMFFTGQVYTDGNADLDFWSVTNYGSVGVNLPPLNKNLKSTKVSTTKISHTPTGIVLDNILARRLITGGSGFLLAGGSGGGVHDSFLLPAGTMYSFRITNRAGVAARIQASFFFNK